MLRIVLARRHVVLPILGALLVLTLSSCQSETLEPTPGADVSPLYTAAAQTLTAQEPAVPLVIVTATPQVPVVPLILVTPTGPVVPVTGATIVVPATGGGIGGGEATESCQNAAFLSDVTVPDGTVLAAGQTFVKTWAISNTGTCPWTTGDRLVLVNGEPMGGSQVPLAGAVAVGQTANLSVNLTAPVVAGNYSGTWRLQDPAGNYFGDVLTVVITVSGAAGPSSP